MESSKNRWAMTDSEEEEEQEQGNQENIITSLPTLEEPKAQKLKKKKKSKTKVKEEEKIDPNLTTKLTNETKVEAKNLRPDGTTASKKEMQKKELDELDSILSEFGLQPQENAPTEAQQEEANKQGQQKGKAKVPKKEVFESVRAEINARTSKKSKKKDKLNYPR